MLHLVQAVKMVSEGKTEEVFQTFLAEFEFTKSRGHDRGWLRIVARQVEDKWKRTKPGEDQMDRMSIALKDYL